MERFPLREAVLNCSPPPVGVGEAVLARISPLVGFGETLLARISPLVGGGEAVFDVFLNAYFTSH